MNTPGFTGSHWIACYTGCDLKALMDHPGLRNALEQAAQHAGATVLKCVDHPFPNGGYTAVVLLAESHASLHTYPEIGCCFLDFFSCGTQASAKAFDELLQVFLKPTAVKEQTLDR